MLSLSNPGAAARWRPSFSSRFSAAELTFAGSAVAGVAAGWVGHRVGPAVLVVLPLMVIAGLVVFERVALAPCLVVLATPVGLVSLPLGVDLAQAAAGFVVLLVAIQRLTAGRPPLALPRELGWGLGVLVIAVLSAGGAPRLDAAVRQILGLALALALVGALVAATSSFGDVRRVSAVLAAVGTLTCLVGLMNASDFRSQAGGQVVDNRLRGTFTEPNQFGIFSAVVLLVSVGLFLSAERQRQRYAAGVAAAVALAALALSLSRGAWIGAAVGAGLMLWLLPAARRGLLIVSVPLVLLAASVAVLQPEQPQLQVVQERVSTFGNVTANPYDNRPAIWTEGRRQTLESPWLGQGPGQFPVVSTRSASGTATFSAQHAHDVLLTVSAELGLVAAALVVGFTLTMLALLRRTVARLRDRPDAALVAGLGAALAVVVGQGLVDFTLRNSVVLLVLSTVLGLLFAASRIVDERATTAEAAAVRQAA